MDWVRLGFGAFATLFALVVLLLVLVALARKARIQTGNKPLRISMWIKSAPPWPLGVPG